jgi:hypothetical protein
MVAESQARSSRPKGDQKVMLPVNEPESKRSADEENSRTDGL